MKFSVLASTLATLATAARVDLSKRDGPLDLHLEMVGNTAVKASLTNQGNDALKIVKSGTFLDTAAVEKVEVFSGETKVEFDGIRLRIATNNLEEAAFQVIHAGETISVEFDVAEMHDLSSGGTFNLISSGELEYTSNINSTDIAGSLPYNSNTLAADISGAPAGLVKAKFHERGVVAKRSVVTSCIGPKSSAMTNAMSFCHTLATNAQAAAWSGPAGRMVEYYKSSSTSTRTVVANVFSRIAQECSSTSYGTATYYCTDVFSSCSPGVLAYTYPSASLMVNCDLYFTALPSLTGTCHYQDQTTTMIHEMTHLSQVKGTLDYGVYGYAAAKGLTAAQNLNHADTYALFANSIYAGC